MDDNPRSQSSGFKSPLENEDPGVGAQHGLLSVVL